MKEERWSEGFRADGLPAVAEKGDRAVIVVDWSSPGNNIAQATISQVVIQDQNGAQVALGSGKLPPKVQGALSWEIRRLSRGVRA